MHNANIPREFGSSAPPAVLDYIIRNLETFPAFLSLDASCSRTQASSEARAPDPPLLLHLLSEQRNKLKTLTNKWGDLS